MNSMRRLHTRLLSLLLVFSQLPPPVSATDLSSFFASPVSVQTAFYSPNGRFQEEALASIALWVTHPVESYKRRSSRVREDAKERLEQVPKLAETRSKKEIEDQARADFFIHNDGIDFVSHAALLSRSGVTSHLLEHDRLSLSQVVKFLRQRHAIVNEGYVQIGLRLLADQGWVTESEVGDELFYQLTPKGRTIMQHPGALAAYERAASFIETELATVEDIEVNFPFHTSSRRTRSGATTYEDWIQEALKTDAFGILDAAGNDAAMIRSVKTQLWGTLLGPTAAALAFHHILDVFENGHRASLAEIESVVARQGIRFDPQRLRSALDLLTAAGWLKQEGPSQARFYQPTLLGEASMGRAASYGVPVSYLPMFSQVNTLYFGHAEEVFELDAQEHERHVARKMNIFGAKAAHEAHFRRFVPKLAELFDNDDFENQPQFILDMGAGEGAFLEMAYDYVKKHTKRGQHLKEHPLWIVGTDLNRVALENMELNFRAAGIETFHVFKGDINDPDAVAADLKRLGLDPMAGVHTSTFLIHNRPWLRPSLVGRRGDYKTGAFVAPQPEYAAQGYAVSNGDVDQNLLDWIGLQKKYLERFGMFFIELHSAPADVTARNEGVFAGTSYDATHFTSGQYIIPIPHFLKLMEEAGMELIYIQPMPKPKQDGLNVPNGLYHFRTKRPAPVSATVYEDARPIARVAMGSSLALWIVSLIHQRTVSLHAANAFLRSA